MRFYPAWLPATIEHLKANPRLITIAVSLFLGILASSFLSLYLAVNFARQGFWPIVIYLETWLMPADLILFPAFFWLMKKSSPRNVTWATLFCQIVGIGFIVVFHNVNKPWVVGPMVALFATGFWQMYHLAIASHSNQDTRGFEVTFLTVVMEAGGLLGASAGAVLSLVHLAFAPHYIAFALQAVATISLGVTLPKAHVKAGEAHQGELAMEGFWECVHRFPRQNVGIAVGALHELSVVMLISTWLVSRGYPIITLGGLRVCGTLATFLLAPLCGRLIHRQSGGEFKLAALAGVVAWVAVLAIPGPSGLIPAFLLWPLSAFFMRTGLESRYYSRRSATQLLVRVIILALVRMPAIPLLCWFATRQTHLYPVTGIVIALIILPYGAYLLRSEKERAL